MALPKCGHKKRDGSTCKLAAGWGTDHLGQGICRKHHGNRGNLKHGLYSKYLPKILSDHYAAAKADPRLTDILQEVEFKRSLLARKVDDMRVRQSLDWEEVEALCKISMAISQDLERWHKMTFGERLVVRIEKVRQLARVVIQAAEDFIPDPLDRRKFASRVESAFDPGVGDGNNGDS